MRHEDVMVRIEAFLRDTGGYGKEFAVIPDALLSEAKEVAQAHEKVTFGCVRIGECDVLFNRQTRLVGVSVASRRLAIYHRIASMF